MAGKALAIVALVIGGCSATHGEEGDAGASECVDEPGVVETIVCPEGTFAAGDVVVVQVSHGVAACCAGGEGSLGVSNDGLGEWVVESTWTDVCGCCEECECVGPSESASVAVGPLVSGVNTVRGPSGGGCELVAEEPVPECTYGAEALAAARLFRDQTDDATLWNTTLYSCFCTPRLFERRRGVDLGICDCGDVCGDGEATYVAHHVGATLPLGVHSRQLGSSAREVEVFDRSSCAQVEVTGMSVREVPDRESAWSTGPQLRWIRVSGEVSSCCGDRLLVAHSEATVAGQVEVSLFDCSPDPCDCESPDRRSFSALHSAGALPAGTRLVGGDRELLLE